MFKEDTSQSSVTPRVTPEIRYDLHPITNPLICFFQVVSFLPNFWTGVYKDIEMLRGPASPIL